MTVTISEKKWYSVAEVAALLGFGLTKTKYLGLRRGEVLGLTWHDVKLDAAEIHITWQLQRAGGQLHHRETKTPGSAAVLPLPDICATALKLRAERQADDRGRAGDAWQDTGFVFTSRYGPYEPRNFNRQFASRCQAAGVRYIKPHGTRRTSASLVVALDVHPRVAMQILRHSQIAVTMEIYSQVPPAKTRSALKRLGRQVEG